MMKQLTLNAPFTLRGKGLHSGMEITATFNPAPDNFGYRFKRVDLEGQPEIEAVAENVIETTRGTVLGKKE
ncbi:MAG: UDP-3-O-acyl-N-acetylglucosamine deacetylase, partial [Muribaculaceae bacterium]|nr:UDP-3-O-acyl-N-acetylglucosamine deacetylase [Muribaculaceae bacterium]